MTDLDRVVPTNLPSLRGPRQPPKCWLASRSCLGTNGNIAGPLAGIEAGATLYHTLGLSTLDVQRICDQEGIDAHLFGQELDRLNLHYEAANPAMLQTLVAVSLSQPLTEKRSQALELIWGTLKRCARSG